VLSSIENKINITINKSNILLFPIVFQCLTKSYAAGKVVTKKPPMENAVFSHGVNFNLASPETE
jgi:hypothetical protein